MNIHEGSTKKQEPYVFYYLPTSDICKQIGHISASNLKLLTNDFLKQLNNICRQQ